MMSLENPSRAPVEQLWMGLEIYQWGVWVAEAPRERARGAQSVCSLNSHGLALNHLVLHAGEKIFSQVHHEVGCILS